MLNCCLIINNAVQGVQGVQGKKSSPLHSLKPTRGAAFSPSVQGVHPTPSRAGARTRTHTPTPAQVHASPLHTLHTLHRPRVARPARVQGVHTRLHTLHNTQLLFKKMNKIVCGKDNAAHFNAQLRDRLPAFHALAKELYQHGLINGLAGATLEQCEPTHNPTSDAPHSAASAKICRDCGHWQADSCGDGTGIGHCALNAQPHQLKWPQQTACHHYEER